LLRVGIARTVSEAIDFVRKVRPGVVVRGEVLMALNEYSSAMPVLFRPGRAWPTDLVGAE
jgi:hypothetical protein